jgi:hypothetical protein
MKNHRSKQKNITQSPGTAPGSSKSKKAPQHLKCSASGMPRNQHHQGVVTLR